MHNMIVSNKNFGSDPKPEPLDFFSFVVWMGYGASSPSDFEVASGRHLLYLSVDIELKREWFKGGIDLNCPISKT